MLVQGSRRGRVGCRSGGCSGTRSKGSPGRRPGCRLLPRRRRWGRRGPLPAKSHRRGIRPSPPQVDLEDTAVGIQQVLLRDYQRVALSNLRSDIGGLGPGMARRNRNRPKTRAATTSTNATRDFTGGRDNQTGLPDQTLPSSTRSPARTPLSSPALTEGSGEVFVFVEVADGAAEGAFAERVAEFHDTHGFDDHGSATVHLGVLQRLAGSPSSPGHRGRAGRGHPHRLEEAQRAGHTRGSRGGYA